MTSCKQFRTKYEISRYYGGTYLNNVLYSRNRLSASRLYEMKAIAAIVQSTQDIHLDLFRSDKHVRDIYAELFIPKLTNEIQAWQPAAKLAITWKRTQRLKVSYTRI